MPLHCELSWIVSHRIGRGLHWIVNVSNRWQQIEMPIKSPQWSRFTYLVQRRSCMSKQGQGREDGGVTPRGGCRYFGETVDGCETASATRGICCPCLHILHSSLTFQHNSVCLQNGLWCVTCQRIQCVHLYVWHAVTRSVEQATKFTFMKQSGSITVPFALLFLEGWHCWPPVTPITQCCQSNHHYYIFSLIGFFSMVTWDFFHSIFLIFSSNLFINTHLKALRSYCVYTQQQTWKAQRWHWNISK